MPGRTTKGPIIAPTKTSVLVCPRVSFKFINESSVSSFESLFIWEDCNPEDLLIPLASYITIREIHTERANIELLNPKSQPIPEVTPVINAEWLEGIPPVSNMTPNLNFFSDMKLNIIFNN